ncbi:restriction endonuclease subunit S [Parabacteroides johnsonii]|uniref:restriction endonuclease subunit S n=1 Tax=Parabacteroides johnsonii TaxID=387661 RepID=UPI0011DE1092|nr:restriction endonuclease subunit S [Parabacteroides johnsonii]
MSDVPPLRFPEFCGEWECTSIGNIGEIKNGPFGSVLHAEDYVEEGIPIVTTEHFKTGLMPSDKFGIPQVSNEDYIRLKGYRLETNDIVFSRVGSVDINAHVGIEQNGWLFSGRVLRVRPKHDVDSLFLHYALSTEAVKRDIRNRAVGQTMPSINTPILSSTTIRLPKELSEQKKVAHFLRLLDERIATQNKIIEKLQSLIKGLVDELMTVLLKGKLYPFSSFYIKAGEGGTPTTSVVEYYTEGTIPFIKIDDLSCKYLTNNKDFITELGMQKSSTWLIPSKSVIYSNGATIGAISINEYPVCTKQGILGIVPNTNINVEYLYLLMSSSYFSKKISRIITEGTMKTAYLKDINHIKCPLPSMAQQKNITNLTSSIEEKLSIEQELLRFLNLQKQYLLRMMFI